MRLNVTVEDIERPTSLAVLKNQQNKCHTVDILATLLVAPSRSFPSHAQQHTGWWLVPCAHWGVFEWKIRMSNMVCTKRSPRNPRALTSRQGPEVLADLPSWALQETELLVGSTWTSAHNAFNWLLSPGFHCDAWSNIWQYYRREHGQDEKASHRGTGVAMASSHGEDKKHLRMLSLGKNHGRPESELTINEKHLYPR